MDEKNLMEFDTPAYITSGPYKIPLYREKNLECFHQKPSFLFDWRKKDYTFLDDMGVSKLSGFFFWGKWTNPFMSLTTNSVFLSVSS